MTRHPLQQHYHLLTSRERFRLIGAASGRGDESERDALVLSAPRLTLQVPHHFPESQAFAEVSQLTFLELLEDAGSCLEFIHQAGQPDRDTRKPATKGEKTSAEQWWEAVHVSGYLLQAKWAGWQCFCQQFGLPATLLWELWPGHERLQQSLRLTKDLAYTEEGMQRWLDHGRPAGAPANAKLALTPTAYADGLWETFASRVRYWGGSSDSR